MRFFTCLVLLLLVVSPHLRVRAQNVCTVGACTQLTGPGPWPASAQYVDMTFAGANIQIQLDLDSQYKYNLVTFAGGTVPGSCDFDSRIACGSQARWDVPSAVGCIDRAVFTGTFDDVLGECGWTRTDLPASIVFSHSMVWTGVRDRAAITQQRSTTRLLSVSYPKVDPIHFHKPLFVNISHPTSITITATPIQVNGGNLQVFVTDVNINAVPANPILTVTLTAITDNPFSVGSLAVTTQPADISAAAPVITAVSCSTLGQPCTQTIVITHTINTACPTRTQLNLDEFEYTATFVCAPVETCGAAPTNALMALMLTSEDYCPDEQITALTGTLLSFEGVDQANNAAYPNNGGSASSQFIVNQNAFFEATVDAVGSVVFSSATLDVVRITLASSTAPLTPVFGPIVIFDVAQPLLNVGVQERDTGFTDSAKKTRFFFPIDSVALNIPEGEVLGSNEYDTVTVECDVIVDFAFTGAAGGGHHHIAPMAQHGTKKLITLTQQVPKHQLFRSSPVPDERHSAHVLSSSSSGSASSQTTIELLDVNDQDDVKLADILSSVNFFTGFVLPFYAIYMFAVRKLHEAGS